LPFEAPAESEPAGHEADEKGNSAQTNRAKEDNAQIAE